MKVSRPSHRPPPIQKDDVVTCRRSQGKPPLRCAGRGWETVRIALPRPVRLAGGRRLPYRFRTGTTFGRQSGATGRRRMPPGDPQANGTQANNRRTNLRTVFHSLVPHSPVRNPLHRGLPEHRPPEANAGRPGDVVSAILRIQRRQSAGPPDCARIPLFAPRQTAPKPLLTCCWHSQHLRPQ